MELTDRREVMAEPIAENEPLARPTLHPPTSLAEFLRIYDETAKHDFFQSPRYRIHYTVMGEGAPVYVVPGICCTRRIFAPLAVELSRYRRVILYNLPGIEARDGSKLSRYTLDDYWQDLVCLADHLGDSQIPLLGFSFGTTISVRALHGAPDRFPRAMLVGGFARRPLTVRERIALHLLRYWPGRLRHIPGMNAVSRYNHARELNYRSPELIEFLVRESNRTSVYTCAAQILSVDQTDVRDLLPKIQQPCMVVHGSEDRLVPVRYGAELARLLPNVQVMLIPHCGHMPHLSHPELLARTAKRFFSENGKQD